MAVRDIVPVPGASFEETLASANPDLLRAMVAGFAQQLMGAEADALRWPGTARSARSGRTRATATGRVLGHAGRERGAGDPEAAAGSYFPEWLLERRSRAEQALISVVATCYLLGVSTRRVEKLAQSLGVTSCRSRRSARWPRRWMRGWRSFATGRWMARRIPSYGSMR